LNQKKVEVQQPKKERIEMPRPKQTTAVTPAEPGWKLCEVLEYGERRRDIRVSPIIAWITEVYENDETSWYFTKPVTAIYNTAKVTAEEIIQPDGFVADDVLNYQRTEDQLIQEWKSEYDIPENKP
jgi:hypothetical protein